MNKSDFSVSLETKALYNSLRMLGTDRPVSKQDSWKRKDYRGVVLQNLFEELKRLGIKGNTALFYQWKDYCETPEELVDFLSGDQEIDDETRDHIYLLIFELWRRLVPEKRCLSIVADEIDYIIYAFDSSQGVDDEAVEKAIDEWVRILNRLHDEGFTGKDALRAIEPYFAHDVPEFIIDFLLDVSSRLDHERFFPIFEKTRLFLTAFPIWVKVIDVKFCLHEDCTIVNKKLGELVAHVLTGGKEESDVIFSLCEIALALEREELFFRLLDHVLLSIEVKEDLEVILDLLADFLSEKQYPVLKQSLEGLLRDEKRLSPLLLKERILKLVSDCKKV